MDTSACARVIDVPGDYPRIQEAIEVAIDGDVVFVQPGTYFEVIDFGGKAITVTGTAPEDSMVVAQTVVDGHGQSSVVTFDNDPLFRSFRGYDYLLAPRSPCIDAGDPAIEDRISDWYRWWPDWYPNAPRSDMGAYGGAGNWNWAR